MHYGVFLRLWNKQDEQMFHLVTAILLGWSLMFLGLAIYTMCLGSSYSKFTYDLDKCSK